MKLWILRPIDPNGGPWFPWYDKAFGFVVRAESEKEARELVAFDAGDESWEAWVDSKYSSCVELTPIGEREIIIKDFAAA